MVRRILMSLGCLALSAQIVFAQAQNAPTQPRPTDQPGGQTQPGAPRPGDQAQMGAPGRTMVNDAQLTQWLLVLNQNEIALAKVAQQQAQSDDVKQFAQQMIQDHQQLVDTLQGIAGGGRMQAQRNTEAGARNDDQNAPDSRRTAGNNQNPNPTDTPRPGDNQPGNENARPGATQPGAQASNRPQTGNAQAGNNMAQRGPVGLVALVQELGYECFQASKEELSQKSGAEFDKCYIGMQVGAHQQALVTLKVFGRHASGPLQQAIADAQPKVEQHLQHAKDLMKQLDSDVATQAGREGNQPKR